MRIGIDVSQIVYEGTGVARYVQEMVRSLIATDTDNEYVLFGSSLRQRLKFTAFYTSLANTSRVTLKIFPIPPTVLSYVWNILHIVPITWLIGPVDIFWSSDWTQPPLGGAKGVTTIHDLIVLKYPEESHGKTEYTARTLRISPNIVETHKKRLSHVIRECSMIFCDSIATKNDCQSLLHVDASKLHVIYPGVKV